MEFFFFRDLDQASMEAVAALLAGLPLQPEESDRGDLMEAKSQLFLKWVVLLSFYCFIKYSSPISIIKPHENFLQIMVDHYRSRCRLYLHSYWKWFIHYTVKPVYKGHPGEILILVFYRQVVFIWRLLCFILSMKGYKSMAFTDMMVFIGRWSLTLVWL